jgi:hypothetical protein
VVIETIRQMSKPVQPFLTFARALKHGPEWPRQAFPESIHPAQLAGHKVEPEIMNACR